MRRDVAGAAVTLLLLTACGPSDDGDDDVTQVPDAVDDSEVAAGAPGDAAADDGAAADDEADVGAAGDGAEDGAAADDEADDGAAGDGADDGAHDESDVVDDPAEPGDTDVVDDPAERVGGDELYGLTYAGEPATVTAFSPALRAVIADGALDELATALDVPDELVPTGEDVAIMAIYGEVGWLDGEPQEYELTWEFMAADPGDGGARFVDALADADWEEVERSPASADGLEIEQVRLERDGPSAIPDSIVAELTTTPEVPGAVLVNVTSRQRLDRQSDDAAPTSSELAFVDALILPGDADPSRVGGGFVVPELAQISETGAQIRRTASVLVTDEVADSWLDDVRDGVLEADAAVEVVEERDDGETLSLQLEHAEGIRIDVTRTTSEVIDPPRNTRLTIRVNIPVTDLEPGISIEDLTAP